ncbi:MAG: C13 family peptidase [Sphingomonadales bacterium]
MAGGVSSRIRLRPCILAVLAFVAFGCPVAGPGVVRAQQRQDAAPTKIDFRGVMHMQRKLVLEQARALAPQRPGVADLYFIGFGGDAKQNVFLSEVRFAKSLFDQRFGTDHRSIVMVNNRATIDELPLANLDNLRLALNFVSRTIDREEDVVFLFITSHGSRDHQLWLDMPPLSIDNINVPALQKVLDQSRIKWRVIVISACYSGGFVEALSDDQTLMMTAARADRTSFGCTNTAKFTYFGRAYFAEALRLEYSFVKAFRMAEGTIRALERQQRFQQSFPQIHIGKAIGGKLDQIETRLRQAAQPAGN